jgi:hypothetical protein
MLLGALVTVAHAAVIYKWTDAQGVVHYSDQPVEGAEKIVTAGGSTYSGAASVKGLQGLQGDKKEKTGPGLAFDTLSISSPTAEQSFFGDDSIPVALAAIPALKANQVVSWSLNGAPLSQTGQSFSLQSLARGTYALAATVTDQTTGQTMSAGSVTFYVRQPSELSPQHHR